MSSSGGVGPGGGAGGGSNEKCLASPPTDGITNITFSPKTCEFLLASSWDRGVYLYDVTNNALKYHYQHAMPVLDCTFMDGAHAYSGGLDCQLKSVDLVSGEEQVLGKHDGPVSCVDYCPDVNVIITGSWDSTVRVWDPRAPPDTTGVHPQPDKVYTMSVCGDKLLVGTAGRKLMIWDLRQMSYVHQRRDSNLKYQTRCVRAFPNHQAFVLTSIEGRVAVEYMSPSYEAQRKKYAFKCHRIKEDGMEYIYPVNAVDFHNIHNTFATGGADGFVNIWDGFNKKRLCQFHRYPTSISSLAFSHDGRLLAIASSYGGELGPVDTYPNKPADEIYVRMVTDTETKPK